jgi:hypothetical protein
MHGRQAAGWILLFSISCFQIFQQVSTIFILADLSRSAAAAAEIS